jgi:hypothetical protein
MATVMPRWNGDFAGERTFEEGRASVLTSECVRLLIFADQLTRVSAVGLSESVVPTCTSTREERVLHCMAAGCSKRFIALNAAPLERRDFSTAPVVGNQQ